MILQGVCLQEGSQEGCHRPYGTLPDPARPHQTQPGHTKADTLLPYPTMTIRFVLPPCRRLRRRRRSECAKESLRKGSEDPSGPLKTQVKKLRATLPSQVHLGYSLARPRNPPAPPIPRGMTRGIHWPQAGLPPKVTPNRAVFNGAAIFNSSHTNTLP